MVPEGAAPVPPEPGGAERVGDGGGECAAAAEPWKTSAICSTIRRARSWRSSKLESSFFSTRHRIVEAVVAPGGLLHLVEEGLEGLRLRPSPAARRGRRRCRSPPRSRAAAARDRSSAGRSPRCSRCRPGTPAPPLACDRAAFADVVLASPPARAGGSPPRRSSPRMARSFAPASRIMAGVEASDSTARSASTLRISGLLDQRLAERTAVAGVMSGLHQAGPHPGGGADHAVEPGHVDHLHDGAHAAALLADQPADARRRTRSPRTRWTCCRACP